MSGSISYYGKRTSISNITREKQALFGNNIKEVEVAMKRSEKIILQKMPWHTLPQQVAAGRLETKANLDDAYLEEDLPD